MSEVFLRIPPFPGHRAEALTMAGSAAPSAESAAELAAQLRAARVGGSFWAAQPALPAGRDVLLAPANIAQAEAMADRATDEGLFERTVLLAGATMPRRRGIPRLAAPSDPWHLAQSSTEIWIDANHELALVAALAGSRLTLFGHGKFAGCLTGQEEAVGAAILEGRSYRCPFSGKPISAAEAIALLADWRRLIDANRAVAAIYGVARWKRVTLDPLLWDGTGRVRYARRLLASVERPVLAWHTRTAKPLLATLATRGVAIAELEDGFIRSAGLGANCVPPLSAIVDFSGVYFDPADPSDLEQILEHGDISHGLCQRAAALREQLVHSGVSKYGQTTCRVERPSGSCRRVLITGQVEDDRSMLSGGAGLSNLELIKRARAIEGDAWLIYKPHPDVEAGHRKGHIADQEVFRHANEIDRTTPITALLAVIDALHVITSLAGFEALLRGKPVTVHGVPFYAGWGLTRDLAAIPPRRTRKRSLDELVAAALLLYPRYVDPVTRLPCPAEVVVERMAQDRARISSPLIWLREMEGRFSMAWQRLTGGRP